MITLLPTGGAACAAGVLGCIAATAAGSLPMLLYHRTDAADDILRGGFRDGEGSYMTDVILRGVWLSEVPLESTRVPSVTRFWRSSFPEAVAIAPGSRGREAV